MLFAINLDMEISEVTTSDPLRTSLEPSLHCRRTRLHAMMFTGNNKKAWVAGAAVQDLQRLPKKGLRVYMRAPKAAANGMTDAMTLAGTEQCIKAGDLLKLAEETNGKCSELVNRPNVGLSEYAGTMQALLQNLAEDTAKPIDKSFLSDLASQHNLTTALAIINTQVAVCFEFLPH